MSDGAAGVSARTAALARRLWQRAFRGSRAGRAGDDGSLRQGPRGGTWQQGGAGTAGGRLWPVGRKLRARRAGGDEGARRDLPPRRRGETRFAQRPESRTAQRDPRIGSPESFAKRESTWNTRWPSSNPAATTIWPFASARTPASQQCSTSRSHCGRWATSGAPFLSSSDAEARIAGLAHVGTRAMRENACGPVRTDARRPLARRAKRR